MQQPNLAYASERDAAILGALIEVWAQAGRPHWLPVRGNSMRPLLRDGDAVLVEHTACVVQPGDIVVVRTQAGLVVHRVLRRLPGATLITRGDNTAAADPPIAEAALVGRVSRLRRGHHELDIVAARWRLAGRGIALALRAEGRLRRLLSRSP
jgi:signal peptidase I